MYVATCCASGPGSSIQKFSVRKNCPSETQCFVSTNSLCMIAIWPAGPPKLINPSLTQNQKASRNLASLLLSFSPFYPDSFILTAPYSNRGYIGGQATGSGRSEPKAGEPAAFNGAPRLRGPGSALRRRWGASLRRGRPK